MTALPTVGLMQSTEVGQPFPRDGCVYEEKYDECSPVRLIRPGGLDGSGRIA